MMKPKISSLATAFTVPLLSLLASGSASAESAPKPPNFVYILIDDLGWNHVSCAGSKIYQTPNIDKLAAGGMRFTTAYAPGANCAPSRACLLTGLNTPRHGIYTVGTPDRGKSNDRKLIPAPNKTILGEDFVTLAEVLKPLGYVSASIGKWHLGDDSTGPLAQGFDVNIGGNHAGQPKTYFSPYQNKNLTDGPDGEYLTDRLTSEAITFIEKHAERPFFVYLTHYAVHSPHEAKPEILAKLRTGQSKGELQNTKYAAMIASMDEGVGRILAALKQLNLDQDTLVVFTSDNGGIGNMSPLRGEKGTPYEGGTRVPLIVSWPGHIPEGTISSVPVTLLDLYPTFLELAGGDRKENLTDGDSLVPLLTANGTLDADRPLFWHMPMYLQRTGNNPGEKWRCTPCSIIRKGNWRLIEFFEDNQLELYNLSEDVGESVNLADSHPEIAQALLAELKDWQKSTGALIPSTPNPDYKAPVGEDRAD